jgi:hypothetical protein
VVGDSGSGKSSLVKAGLVPRWRGVAHIRARLDERDAISAEIRRRWQLPENLRATAHTGGNKAPSFWIIRCQLGSHDV